MINKDSENTVGSTDEGTPDMTDTPSTPDEDTNGAKQRSDSKAVMTFDYIHDKNKQEELNENKEQNQKTASPVVDADKDEEGKERYINALMDLKEWYTDRLDSAGTPPQGTDNLTLKIDVGRGGISDVKSFLNSCKISTCLNICTKTQGEDTCLSQFQVLENEEGVTVTLHRLTKEEQETLLGKLTKDKYKDNFTQIKDIDVPNFGNLGIDNGIQAVYSESDFTEYESQSPPELTSNWIVMSDKEFEELMDLLPDEVNDHWRKVNENSDENRQHDCKPCDFAQMFCRNNGRLNSDQESKIRKRIGELWKRVPDASNHKGDTDPPPKTDIVQRTFTNKHLPEKLREIDEGHRHYKDFCCFCQWDSILCFYIITGSSLVIIFIVILWLLFYFLYKAHSDHGEFIRNIPDCPDAADTIVEFFAYLSGVQAAFGMIEGAIASYYFIRRAHDKRNIKRMGICQALIFVVYLAIALWTIITYFRLDGDCRDWMEDRPGFWNVFKFEFILGFIFWSIIVIVAVYGIALKLVNKYCNMASGLKKRMQEPWEGDPLCETKKNKPWESSKEENVHIGKESPQQLQPKPNDQERQD